MARFDPEMFSLRRRGRAVWGDPLRKLRTLESFASTESDGAKDIATAALRVTEPQLRTLLERHAQDERRHAELFRRRAASLRALGFGSAPAAGGVAEPPEVRRLRIAGEVHIHGAEPVRIFDAAGEIDYLARLHVSESRAASLFEVHRELTRDDPATSVIFGEILRDEQFHISYTRAALDRHATRGRTDEVNAALRRAGSSRFMNGWKRLGARSGGALCRGILLALYATLLAPFALVARRRREAAGWREPGVTRDSLAAARSQYQ